MALARTPDGWEEAATRRAAIGCGRPARNMRAGSNFLTRPAPALQTRCVRPEALAFVPLRSPTSARFFKALARSARRRITKDSSNLWLSPWTYGCWGFQRPMPNGRRQAIILRLRGVALFKRLFCRRRDLQTSRSSELPNQLEACQPGGNGTNGQTIWLSLAALGGS